MKIMILLISIYYVNIVNCNNKKVKFLLIELIICMLPDTLIKK